jgi:hypothetical protein
MEKAVKPEIPERNELETPSGELIVSGRRLDDSENKSPSNPCGTHGNFNALVIETEAAC